MAKLSSASIRLVQKMNRRMSDGSYPIYIVVCFHGRVEKSTGVSCLVRDWDSKREVVKRSCGNSVVLNQMLYSVKNRVIQRKNEFEFGEKAYTASMLLQDCVVDLNGKSNIYIDVMNRLMDERRLKDKTRKRYMYGYRKLCDYVGRNDFIIDELNLGFIKDFMGSLSVADSAKRDICACIASCWNYAISKRLVDAADYPFNEFKFTQKYKDAQRDYCIDLVNMKKLREYFLDMVIIRNGNRWTYVDGALERLQKRTSKEFGLCYFLAMYYLNGSAPTDVARLRVGDVSRIVIDGEDYYRVEFYRQKTHTSVSVRLKRNMFSIVLLEHFLGFSRNGYVYPVINWREGMSDEQVQKSIDKCGEKAIVWVRKAFEEINQRTIESNVMNHCQEPLVDVSKVVLYTARHSLASNYLNSPGATVRGCASLLSRSANTIACYIHSLSQDREIADAVSFLND